MGKKKEDHFHAHIFRWKPVTQEASAVHTEADMLQAYSAAESGVVSTQSVQLKGHVRGESSQLGGDV